LPTRVVHRASGVVLVLIPAGEFLMGSPGEEADRSVDERRHRRVITRPFYLGETEVTAGQFRRFVLDTRYQTDAERGVEEGGHGEGAFAATPDGDRRWTADASWRQPFPNLKEYRARDDHPVVHVSWNDARRFVEHYGLQLPTEAQWEYAARAGSRTRFFWGDEEAGGKGYGNVQDTSGRRRFARWNSSFAFDDGVVLLAPAGRYRPNAWRVRDVVGNVSEWCRDAYLKDYPADGTDERAAEGAGDAPRVIRGGSWLDAPDFQRSAKRIGFAPQGRRDFVGFRVAAGVEAVK
jgi:formylglycine-generating enzyme required for sulfatase activity